jgi:hypothetical protein
VSRSLSTAETGLITTTGGMLDATLNMGISSRFLNWGVMNTTGIAVQVQAYSAYIENYGSIVGGGYAGGDRQLQPGQRRRPDGDREPRLHRHDGKLQTPPRSCRPAAATGSPTWAPSPPRMTR